MKRTGKRTLCMVSAAVLSAGTMFGGICNVWNVPFAGAISGIIAAAEEHDSQFVGRWVLYRSVYTSNSKESGYDYGEDWDGKTVTGENYTLYDLHADGTGKGYYYRNGENDKFKIEENCAITWTSSGDKITLTVDNYGAPFEYRYETLEFQMKDGKLEDHRVSTDMVGEKPMWKWDNYFLKADIDPADYLFQKEYNKKFVGTWEKYKYTDADGKLVELTPEESKTERFELNADGTAKQTFPLLESVIEEETDWYSEGETAYIYFEPGLISIYFPFTIVDGDLCYNELEDGPKWYYRRIGGAPEQEVMRGNLNGDDEVSVEDAQLTLNAYASIVAGLESGLTEAQIAAADVNGDQVVSVEDAQLILMYYVKNTVAGVPTTWEELTGEQPQT